MARENYKREVLSDEELDMVNGGSIIETTIDCTFVSLLDINFPRSGAGSPAWSTALFAKLGIRAVIHGGLDKPNEYYNASGKKLDQFEMWHNIAKDRSYYLR